MDHLNIFIGWDSREDIAYQVAKNSIERHSSIPVSVIPLKLDRLLADGFYRRKVDPFASTEFTYSRFLVPHLMGFKGWAMFFDCDFLFFGDVADLVPHQDPNYAVRCVKHNYVPKDQTKMDGQVQTVYPRKNWSSAMMFNCGHPSTQKLNLGTVNSESGAYLHQMKWAKDAEIGALPSGWNWLEGWDEKPTNSKPEAVHFTRGGPWFENWQNVDYADEWREEVHLLPNPEPEVDYSEKRLGFG